MPTPHNEANLNDIASTVIMPGDPLRAQYIAENFLENAQLVNKVRGMYAYTGFYKGKKIKIMAYNVQNIIRIGSCGGYLPKLKLFDIILAKNVFSESNFALTLNNEICHEISGSEKLNSIIKNTANEKNIKIYEGNTVCTDCFDVYMTDVSKFLERLPNNFNPYGAEMEAFSLFYVAKILNKNASCLMSVVDSKFIKDIATPEERQNGLTNMIKLALDSSLNIED